MIIAHWRQILRQPSLVMQIPHFDKRLDMICLSDDTLESVLEPFDNLILLDLVCGTNRCLAAATLGNTLTRAGPSP
jgi:hypothetical protein